MINNTNGANGIKELEAKIEAARRANKSVCRTYLHLAAGCGIIRVVLPFKGWSIQITRVVGNAPKKAQLSEGSRADCAAIERTSVAKCPQGAARTTVAAALNEV